jgi:hypothetical protein
MKTIIHGLLFVFTAAQAFGQNSVTEQEVCYQLFARILHCNHPGMDPSTPALQVFLLRVHE